MINNSLEDYYFLENFISPLIYSFLPLRLDTGKQDELNKTNVVMFYTSNDVNLLYRVWKLLAPQLDWIKIPLAS